MSPKSKLNANGESRCNGNDCLPKLCFSHLSIFSVFYVVKRCLKNPTLTIHCGQSLENIDLDSSRQFLFPSVRAANHQAKGNLLITLTPHSVYFRSCQRFPFDGAH